MNLKTLKYPLLALGAVLLGACASIGHPEGGPRDYTPPRFLESSPAPGSVNQNPRRIVLTFDENITLDDAFNKVIVSPAPPTTPVVRSLGRKVTVELRDTLQPNTSYTVDFADAVKDLNEGNVLDGLAIDFATGPTLDTLRISGMVFEARTLEPAQGITVAVTRDMSDTALTTVPFSRIARTNTLGQFTVRNLAPGTYRIFALNDVNRDRMWDPSEDIAFYYGTVTPTAQTITVTDTLLTTDGTRDSLVTHPATLYLPNDVVLTWFNENRLPVYLNDNRRPQRNLLEINFSAPADSLPHITVARGPLAGISLESLALRAQSPRGDSLQYWLTDLRALAHDTLSLAMRYQATDTLQALSWRTDTLNFVYKAPKAKKKDKDAVADTVQPTLTLTPLTQSVLDIGRPIRLRLDQPIGTIDTALFALEALRDTLWVPEPSLRLVRDSLAPLTTLVVNARFEPGAKYRLRADSAAILSVYSLPTRALNYETTIRKPEDYSQVTFTLTAPGDTAWAKPGAMFVELLGASDQPVYTAPVAAGGKAHFALVNPGTYFARVVLDANGNGRWDTGNVALGLQPEQVAYYPKKMELRANWEQAYDWDIYATPLDLQKPYDVKKNRPKLRKGERAPGQDDDGQQYDEWGEPLDGGTRQGRDRGRGSMGTFGNMGGGRQQSSGNTGTLKR